MSIETAQQTIVDALPDLVIDLIDDKNFTQIKAEGNLLVYEGGTHQTPEDTYVFGLYVAKKVLDKRTSRIYADLDYIRTQMIKAGLNAPFGDDAGINRVDPNGLENGILEYRCELFVTEGKMPK